ncbi:mediator of DNA damage checkpoint protein 1-like isoform X2 [Ornithodoros turicata]
MDFDMTQAIAENSEEEGSDKFQPSCVLKVDAAKDSTETFQLKQGANVIGRLASSDICLDSKAVSQRHLCIHVHRCYVLIEDLGSRNKTKKGKVTLVPHVRYNLERGEEICIGGALRARVDLGNEDSDSDTCSESLLPQLEDDNLEASLLKDSVKDGSPASQASTVACSSPSARKPVTKAEPSTSASLGLANNDDDTDVEDAPDVKTKMNVKSGSQNEFLPPSNLDSTEQEEVKDMNQTQDEGFRNMPTQALPSLDVPNEFETQFLNADTQVLSTCDDERDGENMEFRCAPTQALSERVPDEEDYHLVTNAQHLGVPHGSVERNLETRKIPNMSSHFLMSDTREQSLLCEGTQLDHRYDDDVYCAATQEFSAELRPESGVPETSVQESPPRSPTPDVVPESDEEGVEIAATTRPNCQNTDKSNWSHIKGDVDTQLETQALDEVVHMEKDMKKMGRPLQEDERTKKLEHAKFLEGLDTNETPQKVGASAEPNNTDGGTVASERKKAGFQLEMEEQSKNTGKKMEGQPKSSGEAPMDTIHADVDGYTRVEDSCGDYPRGPRYIKYPPDTQDFPSFSELMNHSDNESGLVKLHEKKDNESVDDNTLEPNDGKCKATGSGKNIPVRPTADYKPRERKRRGRSSRGQVQMMSPDMSSAGSVECVEEGSPRSLKPSTKEVVENNDEETMEGSTNMRESGLEKLHEKKDDECVVHLTDDNVHETNSRKCRATGSVVGKNIPVQPTADDRPREKRMRRRRSRSSGGTIRGMSPDISSAASAEGVEEGRARNLRSSSKEVAENNDKETTEGSTNMRDTSLKVGENSESESVIQDNDVSKKMKGTRRKRSAPRSESSAVKVCKPNPSLTEETGHQPIDSISPSTKAPSVRHQSAVDSQRGDKNVGEKVARKLRDRKSAAVVDLMPPNTRKRNAPSKDVARTTNKLESPSQYKGRRKNVIEESVDATAESDCHNTATKLGKTKENIETLDENEGLSPIRRATRTKKIQDEGSKRTRSRENLAESSAKIVTGSQVATKKNKGTASRQSGKDIILGKEETPKTERRRASKPKVLFTGLEDTEGQEIVESLGGFVAQSVTECTHLVTDKFRRTVKALCCIAMGVPIITIQWLQKCQASGSFIDHAPYLLRDKMAEKNFEFSLGTALELAAQRRLLVEWSVHVTASVKPAPEDMREIITCAGGKYLSKIPQRFVEKTVIISCALDKKAYSAAAKKSIPVVSSEFLLTGLLQYKIDIEKYAL